MRTSPSPRPAGASSWDMTSTPWSTNNSSAGPIPMCSLRNRRRALVTFDLGFGDPREYPRGTHRGVILLRLRYQQPDNVVVVLQRLAENHDLDELAGCVVVVTGGLIRIRWPG